LVAVVAVAQALVVVVAAEVAIQVHHLTLVRVLQGKEITAAAAQAVQHRQVAAVAVQVLLGQAV
jgi:hypothetical protein